MKSTDQDGHVSPFHLVYSFIITMKLYCDEQASVGELWEDRSYKEYIYIYIFWMFCGLSNTIHQE